MEIFFHVSAKTLKVYLCAKFHCDRTTNNEDTGGRGECPPPNLKMLKKVQSDYAGINLTGHHPPPPSRPHPWATIFSVKILTPGTASQTKLRPPGRKRETKSPPQDTICLVRMIRYQ